jgi:hypothetical protein
MAFFSLTDIKLNSGEQFDRNFSFQTDYNSDNRRYPSDLGNSDKGHYMMFYVKVQERSIGQNPGLNNVLSRDQSGSSPNNGFFDAGKSLINAGVALYQNLGEKLDNNISSTSQDADAQEGGFYGQSSSSVDIIRKSKSALAQGSKHLTESAILNRSNFFRTTKRTKDTIALYMPDTLTFDYKQSFSTTSVTKDMGLLGGLVQAGASLKDQLNSNASGLQKLNNMSPFGAELVKSKFGGDTLFTALTSAFGGALAVNPQLEVIYQSPSFRNFRFQFMFYPRSEKEASDVLDIIDLFRYHQAPEIMSSSYGRYLIPPSEFDIKFYYNGVENTNIHSIGNCVLTDVALDFAPNGYQSYETLSNIPQKGKTGMPVAIRMDLSFQETEIQTKSSLRNEYTNKLQSGDSRLGTFVAGGSDSSGIGRDAYDASGTYAAAIASGQPDDSIGTDEAVALNAADDFRRASDIDDISTSEGVGYEPEDYSNVNEGEVEEEGDE